MNSPHVATTVPTPSSKLAQVAKGCRTCEGCGKNKDLSEYEIHARWGTPIRFCADCMKERRSQGALKRSATARRNRAERERERNEQATVQIQNTQAQVEREARAEHRARVAWALARLEGYALATSGGDGPLEKMVTELQQLLQARPSATSVKREAS